LDLLLSEAEEALFRDAVGSGEISKLWASFDDIKIQKASIEDARTRTDQDRAVVLRLIDADTADYDASPKLAAFNAKVRKRFQSWLADAAATILEERVPDVSVAACSSVGRMLVELKDLPRARKILEAGKTTGATGATDAPEYVELMHTMACLEKSTV